MFLIFSDDPVDGDSSKSPSRESVVRCVPSDCPPEFICPISQEIMRDPVIASDGCVPSSSCLLSLVICFFGCFWFALLFSFSYHFSFTGLFMRDNTSTHG